MLLVLVVWQRLLKLICSASNFNKSSRQNSAAVTKLPDQDFVATRLKSSLHIIYGRHLELVNRIEISIFKWERIYAFYEYFFSLSPTILSAVLTTLLIRRLSCKNKSCLTLASNLVHIQFFSRSPYCLCF